MFPEPSVKAVKTVKWLGSRDAATGDSRPATTVLPHPGRAFFARGEEGMHALGQHAGLLDTVVERDPAIAVAAEEQAAMLLQAFVDPCNPLEMSKVILRNRALPAHQVL